VKRRIYTLDVFTTKAYEGNPLAVVTDGDGLRQKRMQAIAREMNLAETVFMQKPTSVRALARLRIFTTKQELPLAGHPVIGTWFLMAQLGVVPAQEGSVHILQQTGAGVLPVEINFHDGRPVSVTMTQKPAEFRPLRGSSAALARALGLKAGDLNPALPLECVSTGIFNLMVPLKNRAALKRIRLNIQTLQAVLGRQATMAYCFALGAAGAAFSRGMIPWEIYEDPATGSAAGSLGAYLVRHEKLKPGARLRIEQGVEMGRPSKIRVEICSEKGTLVPRVTGSAVTMLEGTLEA
jgi:trans-2,3-dihydro-3-hydroxyanthranilate isomerase